MTLQTAPAVDGTTVSVVVPVYNGASFLAETLAAVAAQSHKNIQLIVVDDASTDDSVAVAKRCAMPVELVQQSNAGVCAARNAGLRLAKGELVTFLDQDDVWFEDHLESHLACFAAHPQAGVVVSPYVHWFAKDGKYPARVRPVQVGSQTDPDFTGWVYHQFLVDCWALTSATTIKRSMLERVGAFDTTLSFGEDWDLWFRLSRTTPFAKLNTPPVFYRQHPTQGSRVIREVDFRCDLLLSNARRHGLRSVDGRGITSGEFDRIVARYQTAFAYEQLRAGRKGLAIGRLLQAWARDPFRTRPLLMALAACGGWRPADSAVEALA